MQLTGSVTHPTTPFPATCIGTPLVTFISLLMSLANQRLEREFRRRQAEPAADDEEYDFVVVGGGSSGCVLAERLSQNPDVSVLLLERGGTEPLETRVPGLMTAVIRDANVHEYLTCVPEPSNCNGTGCVLTVPEVLGGGSTTNALMYVRGSSVDFDQWASIVDDPGWSYDNVLPYFKRAEGNTDPEIAADTEYHSASGPLRVSWQPYRHPVIPLLTAALDGLGEPFRLDINAEGQLGHSIIQTTTAAGERWSAYRGYLQPAMQRGNLRVRTYATATRVLLDDGLRATGVEYRDAAGRVLVARAAREVIVTAGAIGTPHLLMLSGIGPAEELKNSNITVLVDLPVGKQLEDHPRVPGLEFKCGPPLCEVDWPSRRRDLLEYSALRRGPLSEGSLVQIGGFIRTGLDPPPPQGTGAPAKQPDVQLLFIGITEDSNGTRCYGNDPWRFNRVAYMPALLHPRSRGSVRLNATNPRGQPVVRMGYLTDEGDQDLAVLVESLKLGLRLEEPLRQSGLRLDRSSTIAPNCRAFEFGSDDYLRCLVRSTTATLWHWVGTCRMGRDGDEQAVVDSRLRVRGVRGLRVADASVFPTITSGNTNAPTIMVAERASDIILLEHGLL